MESVFKHPRFENVLTQVKHKSVLSAHASKTQIQVGESLN